MSEPIEAEKTAVLSQISVSRETQKKFERYIDLLCEWNKRINIVAESSLPHVWSRHILDSAQLLPLFPSSSGSLIDLGSGAGFPGMVLAIMGVPGVHLIESIGKKANFLRVVSAELGLKTTIHQERVEAIRDLRADVITARALKPLPELLLLANPLMHKDTICLFLKGQKAEEELTEARKYWTFSCDKIPSLSNPSGTVLKISGLRTKYPHGPRRRAKHPKR